MRGAIARLYDVDDDSVMYRRPKIRGKYDHGTIAFRARKGKLVDLDKMYESVWATRLSGGTRSGLVRLDVTFSGTVSRGRNSLVINVSGSDGRFLLIENGEANAGDRGQTPFQKLRAAMANGKRVVRITGRVDRWQGRWPALLRTRPRNPRTIQVTSFQIQSKTE